MIFIKVTECNGNIVLINVDRIEHMTLGTKGTDTYIKLLNNKSNEAKRENYFFVKESIDQIWFQLLPDNSKAPVIMTAAEALEYYKLRDGT